MWVVICGEAQLAFLRLLVKTVRSLAQIEENHFREAELSNRQDYHFHWTRPAFRVSFHAAKLVLKLSLRLNIVAARSWPRGVAIKRPSSIFNKDFVVFTTQRWNWNYDNDLYCFVVVTMDSKHWKRLALPLDKMTQNTKIKQPHCQI